MIFKLIFVAFLYPAAVISAPKEEALCGKFNVSDISSFVDDKNDQLTIVIPNGMVRLKQTSSLRNNFLLKNLFRNEMASYYIKKENWTPLEVGTVGLEFYSIKCSGVDNYVLWVSQSNVTVRRMKKSEMKEGNQINIVGDFSSFGSESGFEGFK